MQTPWQRIHYHGSSSLTALHLDSSGPYAKEDLEYVTVVSQYIITPTHFRHGQTTNDDVNVLAGANVSHVMTLISGTFYIGYLSALPTESP